MKSSGHSCIYDISYYHYWNMNYTDGLYLLQHMCYFLYFGCCYLQNSLLFWKITLYRINQCRFFKCFIYVSLPILLDLPALRILSSSEDYKDEIIQSLFSKSVSLLQVVLTKFFSVYTVFIIFRTAPHFWHTKLTYNELLLYDHELLYFQSIIIHRTCCYFFHINRHFS